MSRTIERSFRAMGSDGHLVVVAATDAEGRALAGRAERRVAELEQRWSRFIPTSEVAQLTARAGEWVAVSPDTVLLVDLAIEAFALSGGSFDPTVLGDVIRSGYDRDFDALAALAPRDAGGAALSALLTGCDDIAIDGPQVRLPAGTGFDPGGIGKGLAADLVSEELLAAGARGVCVNLGGDLRVRGESPDADAGHGWTIAIEHPARPEPLTTIGIGDGAVATSTTLRRRWSTGDVERHHLIDPGTGLPSTSDLELAAVVAHDGWVAEILAKAVLLRGSAHPFDLIDGSGAEALAVDVHGHVHTSAGFHQYASVPARRGPEGRLAGPGAHAPTEVSERSDRAPSLV